MSIRNNSTIAEVYPTSGIFSNLKARKSSEWITELTEEQAALFDTYIKTNFGERILSNIGMLVNSDIDSLTDLIFALFGTKWARLWTDYTVEYNPIWNVDGTETITETRNLSNTETGTDTHTESGTDTRTDTGSETTSSNVYGFNSSSASPSDTETRTPNLTDATQYGHTDTRSADLKHSDTGTITTEHKRGGNIGVTMTQQMLEADADYWNKARALFYKAVALDIVQEITYKISYIDDLY